MSVWGDKIVVEVLCFKNSLTILVGVSQEFRLENLDISGRKLKNTIKDYYQPLFQFFWAGIVQKNKRHRYFWEIPEEFGKRFDQNSVWKQLTSPKNTVHTMDEVEDENYLKVKNLMCFLCINQRNISYGVFTGSILVWNSWGSWQKENSKINSVIQLAKKHYNFTTSLVKEYYLRRN